MHEESIERQRTYISHQEKKNMKINCTDFEMNARECTHRYLLSTVLYIEFEINLHAMNADPE